MDMTREHDVRQMSNDELNYAVNRDRFWIESPHAADVGHFSSVSQARKNGWDKPVEPDLYKIGKKRPVQIVGSDL